MHTPKTWSKQTTWICYSIYIQRVSYTALNKKIIKNRIAKFVDNKYQSIVYS